MKKYQLFETTTNYDKIKTCFVRACYVKIYPMLKYMPFHFITLFYNKSKNEVEIFSVFLSKVPRIKLCEVLVWYWLVF